MLSVPPTNHANRLYGLVTRHRRCGRLKIKSIKVSQLETAETTYQECTRAAQPPVYHTERLYGLVRHRRRRGRIKFKPVKVSQSRKVKTTYQEHARVAQPPTNDPKPSYRVIGLVRRGRGCGWIEIAPVKAEIKHINVKIARETTHLGHGHTTQPCRNHPKRLRRVHTPCHRRVRIKIESVKLKIEYISINQAQEVEKTYLELAQAAQPPRNPSNRIHRVYRPHRRHSRIKSQSTNVSRTGNSGSAYLKRVHAIRATWRSKKGVKRFNKLTFEYRKPGEPWHDVEDHG